MSVAELAAIEICGVEVMLRFDAATAVASALATVALARLSSQRQLQLLLSRRIEAQSVSAIDEPAEEVSCWMLPSVYELSSADFPLHL